MNQDSLSQGRLRAVFGADFSGFIGREDALKGILRYNMDYFMPMLYRTDDFLHSVRVALLLRQTLPKLISVFGSGFNPEKALTLALIHDDAEIVCGDKLVYNVERMTPEQLAKMRQEEENAIETLAIRYPLEINRFNYRALLYNALNKDTLEAQAVSFFDKIDAYCECLHEVHAGNARFLKAAFAYVKKINNYPVKFPGLAKLKGSGHPLLMLPGNISLEMLETTVRQGKPHTAETIGKKTSFPQYDAWKAITRDYFGLEPLIKRRE